MGIAARGLSGAGLATLAVHGGVDLDPVTGAIGPNVATSTNFAAEYGSIGFSAAGTDEALVPFAYAREGHPNAAQLESGCAPTPRALNGSRSFWSSIPPSPACATPDFHPILSTNSPVARWPVRPG